MAAISRKVVDYLDGWTPLHSAGMILTYLPMQGEIDLTALRERVRAGRLVVTRTPEAGPLTVHSIHEPREVHRFGFEQPVAEAAALDPADVEVALVPGLCFDWSGRRLGRGVGYFDRLLAELDPAAARVGVAPAIVPRLPEDEWDIRMTHLVSAEGLVPAR